MHDGQKLLRNRMPYTNQNALHRYTHIKHPVKFPTISLSRAAQNVALMA